MGLGKYFKKRRFANTPEPKGARKASPSKRLKFVVQEHHASSLHYDFRLELDGVLKSWAIPKGPSLDPHEHHLAVQTEDHPYEYRTFEGIIPKDNYGAGNVIIWDSGWYELRIENAQDPEATLRKEFKKGHLTFILHGTKLKGEFALIKMKDGEKNWLFIKKSDEFASSIDVTKQDTSIKSSRRVDELGGAPPALSAWPKKAHPWSVTPMLCTLIDEPFSKEGWLFEIKWDGYRAIGSKQKDDIRLYSRAGTNFLENYPPVAEALRAFTHEVIVDGEIAVVDKEGHPHFEWLQNWRHTHDGMLKYYLFDILWCDGHDLRGMPLKERKQVLKSIMPKHDVLHFSDGVETEGLKLFKELQHHGLEGMVAKQIDSAYAEGVRGATWLKIKTHMRQEVIIGGFTEPRGSRTYLGSLLVGVYDRGKFIYVGHSGGGIPDQQRAQLYKKLLSIERRTSPFAVEPKPNAPVHWVRPELVCEMSFSEWTNDGSMRHPQFKGIREDKLPQTVRLEKSRATSIVSKTVAKAATEHQPFEPTHLDKVFFPKHGYTKGNVMTYYESVADYILPYLKDRPCSLNRMPSGITGESFFQKNNAHLPDWVPYVDIFSESNNANLRWIKGEGLDVLRYMVQLGCVEINPWNSRVGHLEKPDWIVIDLDPEGVGFKAVISVARTVKEVCDSWHIPTYPKTSGKTGIHIYIPMQAIYTYEQAKNLAHLIALEVNKHQPRITSVERLPEKRKHRIYLDFLQNRAGQTLAAPYSLRPTSDATVSMPLHWDEITPSLKPTDFTIKNAVKRLNRTGDLWRPVMGNGITLSKTLESIAASQTKL